MFEKSKMFDLYISELIEEKLKTLAVTDGEYGTLKAKMDIDFEMLETNFNMEEIEIIEGFQGLICDMYAIENKYLYFQGFGDCMRSLKRLEVY